MNATAIAVAVAALVLGVVVGHVAGHVVARKSDRPESVPGPTREEPPINFGPLAEAVDRVAQGIVIADGSGEITYRNRVADELAASRHGRVLVEECVQRLLTEARGGRSCSDSVELFGPPAESFFVSAHPFGDGEGTGAMAVVEDRSEIRRTETVRRDFVANISHELKTPIGAMGLLAETAASEEDPDVMRRLAARMVSESERAGRTVDDLLELSRIEFGDDLDHREVSISEVVSEARARIANAAEQAGVSIEVDLVDDLRVRGDERQLVSAVFNLLDNAVKYSPGGGEVEVRGRLHGSGARMALSVRDRGVGIPRASTQRVFERFYRVDRARSRSTGGTGLGLAIVRHVASNHGGEVTVSSTEGRGSVFTILLPVADAGGETAEP